MGQRTDIDIAAIAARLKARRGELQELSAGTARDRRPVELDQQRVGRLSRMDALQDQAMSLATAERRGQELRRIEAALRRIDEGEFGYCLGCGDDIAGKRLELDPTLATCVGCAGGKG